MPQSIHLTLVIRQPPASQAIAESLLAGNFDASKTQPSDLAASPSDVETIHRFAEAHHLQIVKSDPVARTIVVAGSPDQIRQALEISVDISSLRYKGTVDLPSPLNDIVIAVLGMDTSPIARPYSQ